MLYRALALPETSFFLFGPRGTGKTTWLRSVLPEAAWFDLLDTRLTIELTRRPELFVQRVAILPRGSWVVIDEVQKLPLLLDEVHRLMNEHPGAFRFALTGSSARKLKRADVNLLAGRAVNRALSPLTAGEIGDPFDLDRALAFGTLPAVHLAPDARTRIDILEAYEANYLQEEIAREAVVKSLASFSRFLEVAALANGQLTNVAGIARDTGVARPTVQGYFDVLVDTLLATWLPAWRPRARIKEVQHKKLYLFDCGVVRAITGRLRDPVAPAERGALLETWLLHELRAHIGYAGIGGELAFWRTPGGAEVDFVWTRGATSIGLEVKATTAWRREDGRALAELVREGAITRGFGIYRGAHVLQDGPIVVLPVADFVARLAAGEILASA